MWNPNPRFNIKSGRCDFLGDLTEPFANPLGYRLFGKHGKKDQAVEGKNPLTGWGSIGVLPLPRYEDLGAIIIEFVRVCGVKIRD